MRILEQFPDLLFLLFTLLNISDVLGNGVGGTKEGKEGVNMLRVDYIHI
jgi:hypothetical protein